MTNSLQNLSLTLWRLPQFSRLTKLTTKSIVTDALESSSWVPYIDDGKHTQLLCLPPLTNTGAPLLESNYTQPSNIGSLCRTYSELSGIIHKSLYLVHTPVQSSKIRICSTYIISIFNGTIPFLQHCVWDRTLRYVYYFASKYFNDNLYQIQLMLRLL